MGAQNITTITKILAMSESKGLRMASTTAHSHKANGIRMISAINQAPTENMILN